MKRAIDIAMILLLPMLMAYSLIGESFHEIIGTGMAILFIAHHYLNRSWYGAITKGSCSARRGFQTVLDLLLLAYMVLQPVSGILMSKHMYTFVSVAGVAATARQIHMVSAYWGFVLVSAHAGTHFTGSMRRLRQSHPSTWKVAVAAVVPVSGYGCYAFVTRQLPEYMLMRISFAFFDPSASLVHFFVDYLAMMVLFGAVGGLVGWALGGRGKEKE